MARPLAKRSLGPWATALRVALVFALAFSTTLGAQVAFAASQQDGGLSVQAEKGGSKGGDKDKKPEPSSSASSSSSSSSSSKEPDAPKHYIQDFGIYLQEDENRNVADTSKPGNVKTLSSADAGVVGEDKSLVITKRGEHIKLGVVVDWSDAGLECDPGYVTFKVDDAMLATVTTDANKKSGTLTASGGKNGRVIVTAVLDAGHTADGKEWKTSVAVNLTGQDLTPYVTGIEICDEKDKVIDSTYTFPEGQTTATAVVEFHAKVSVTDPASGASKEYVVTRTNGLSKQTDGQIADLTWTSLYDERGSVSDKGEYRALVEGDNMVSAKSNAGPNGAEVADDVMVILEGAGHPQSSLTIDVAWYDEGKYTPVKIKGQDSITLSVADMEKVGTRKQSYTVYGQFGKANFVTYTGRGVLLVDLLKMAGIDDKEGSIESLRLDCFDTTGYEISWEQLVHKSRYYLPNADIGSEADAQQVAPMLAIESGRAKEGSSDPAEKLDNDDCFRLLFGVGLGEKGENTRMMQRRWINAIHIVLAGSPPSGSGDEPKPGPKPNPNGGGGNGDNGGKGGSSEQGGQGGENGTPTQGVAGEPGQGEAVEQTAKQVEVRHNKGAWSILQSVNKNDSEVDAIDFDNPFAPFTAPTCVGLFAAGGAEAFVRFRWQKRQPENLPSEEAE